MKDRTGSDDAGGGTPSGEVAAEPGSRWHVGVLTRVSYGSESGTLRSEATGRDYGFRWPFVEIRGPIPRVDGLREGMRVGFDLGHTSRGVRVTVIRVFA